MRTDLGTWRGPQADAVVKALKRAGLSPQTEPAYDGTRITVPAEQNDAAHRVLVGAMDDIARAAANERSGGPSSPRRAALGASDPGRSRQRHADDEPPLVSERLRNAAPLVGLVAALLLAAMIPPGAVRTTVFVFALVAFGVLWARRNHDQDEE